MKRLSQQSIFFIATLLVVSFPFQSQADVKLGDIVTQENAAQAEVFLTPATRWMVERGMRMSIIDSKKISWPRAYREATVAVCPSRFEGFGLAPIEAVASGIPVVASDIPPHREFVGGAARLFPPDDAAALAVTITAALDAPPADPALVGELTIQAAARRFLACLGPLLR